MDFKRHKYYKHLKLTHDDMMFTKKNKENLGVKTVIKILILDNHYGGIKNNVIK